MKLELLPSEESARVLEPLFADKSIFLSREVYDFLENEGKLDKLDDMDLVIDFSQNRWEISGNPPVGVPGTIASIVFSVGGTLSTKGHQTFFCRF